MEKYFKNANTSTLKEKHKEELIEMSVEYQEYLQKALEYAIAHGFKIRVFNSKGECYAKQG